MREKKTFSIFESLDNLYTVGEKVGEGTSACVFQAHEIRTKKVYAVKRIFMNPFDQNFGDVQKLKQLKGDHIIEYEGYIRDGQELNIVMHKSSGSLRSLMNQNLRWNKAKILKLLIQVTSSMLKLDKKFIRHLDLKPQNILYEKEDYYKICDFGCAELFDSELSINQHKSLYFGTPRYLPPEVSLGYHETKKNSTDIWSMGVIIYELIYGTHPLIFEEQGERILPQRSNLKKFYDNQIKIEFARTTQFHIDLLKRMLNENPLERISWNGVKQYLIKYHNHEEIQFWDISEAFANYRRIQLLFINAIVIIKENMNYCVHEFWHNQAQNFQKLENKLVTLIFLYSQKFQSLFSHKVGEKLKNEQKIEIKQIKNHIKDEIQKQGKKANFILKAPEIKKIPLYESQLDQIIHKINQNLKRQDQLWNSMKKLNIFFNEFIQMRKRNYSIFSSSKCFREALKSFEIQ